MPRGTAPRPARRAAAPGRWAWRGTGWAWTRREARHTPPARARGSCGGAGPAVGSSRSASGLVGVAWRHRSLHGIGLDLVQEDPNSRVQLRVRALCSGPRQVVHDEIGLDAAALDAPVAPGAEHADLRGSRDAAVDEEVVLRQPDLAAPRARAHDFPEAEPPEPFRERLAVRDRGLVHDRHDPAAERERHVRDRVARAGLPP